MSRPLLPLRFARLYFVAPQAVDVAVGIDGRRLVADVERGSGFITRLEIMDLAAMLRLEIDELDVMLVGHRMGRLSDLDGDGAVLAACDGRNVILGLAIGGASFEPFHRLAAAMRSHLCSAQFEHDVAADGATIEDCLHSRYVLRVNIAVVCLRKTVQRYGLSAILPKRIGSSCWRVIAALLP